jgi:hypothetical protein
LRVSKRFQSPQFGKVFRVSEAASSGRPDGCVAQPLLFLRGGLRPSSILWVRICDCVRDGEKHNSKTVKQTLSLTMLSERSTGGAHFSNRRSSAYQPGYRNFRPRRAIAYPRYRNFRPRRAIAYPRNPNIVNSIN